MGSMYRIDRLEEYITKNIEGQTAARLDATINFALLSGSEEQVFPLDHELLATDSNDKVGKIIKADIAWNEIALILGAVRRALDLGVQGFAHLIGDQSEGGSSISNCLVTRDGDILSVDRGTLAVEHPETLGVVNVDPFNILAAVLHQIFVDPSKSIEGLLALVSGAIQSYSKQLGVLRDVFLLDHIDDGSRLWVRHSALSDGVDLGKGQAEEAILDTLCKLTRDKLGQFNGLILDSQACNLDYIYTHDAGSRAPVTI